MSGKSVRLRLVGNIQRIFDQAVQLVAHRLCKPEVHAQPSADTRFRRVSSVNDGLGQRQINNAIELSSLNEQAWDHGRNAIIDDSEIYVAHAKRLAASNHNLISHQKSPIGTVYDFSSVNLPQAGVQK